MNPIYFFELSGEAGDMPREEVISCAHAETKGDSEIVSSGPGYVIARLPSDSLPFISERLALTRSIGTYLGSFAPEDVDDLRLFTLEGLKYSCQKVQRNDELEGSQKTVEKKQHLLKK